METGLRERKKQRQREAIVEAAIGLFRERGYEQTRIQDILEHADISLGTFYNYFSGKGAVLDEFGVGVIASYVELARDELIAEGIPVAERIRALARACGRAFSSDPAFMTVVVTQSRAFSGGGQLAAHDDPIFKLLSVIFEVGQASEAIRPDVPPLELAETFSGIWIFTVVSWLTEWQSRGGASGDDDAELEGRLMRAFDVFLDGCRAPGSDARG